MRSKVQTFSIDEVRSRFEAWRQNRQGREPIPGELWSAAVELARKNGVTQTAAELHLDGGKLKRLMVAKATSGKSAPAFVELLPPQAVSLPECSIELEGRRGKIRIQLKGASASDLVGLSRALWEAAS
ncbi:MAG TPA: hypothetical protein VHY84_12345 [Bryobacteraceae bacterium]|nr:hypothetical protein [Bryobacteraceae bacterium]